MDLLASAPLSVASYSPAAAYAGWLLRQFGAAVHEESALDPNALGAFLSEGARFDPAPAIDPAGASILITDAPVTPANREAVAAASRSASVIWVTPWGLHQPWASRPATDLTLHAAGGYVHAVGEPDQAPFGPPDSQGSLVAGLFAAIEAARLLRLPPAERPRLVSIPIVEAIAATCIYETVSFQYFGKLRGRAGNRFATGQPVLMTLPCRDGHVGIHAALHPQWVALCNLIGKPEAARDPRFVTNIERALNTDALDRELFLPWLANRTRFEAYHELEAARIPSSPIPSLDEVLASPQLAAREAWRETTTASGRPLRVPGPPARITATNSPIASRSRPDGPWAPGRLRVVDPSMGWAGPLVSHILACFGADVIKVESHRRFDWWRGSRPPGDDPTLALHEQSHVFNTANRGKRGLTLDVTTPRGRELLLELLSTADVVIENFAAGVLERLGLTYDVVSARNPGLIMLRQPAFGSTGPESGYVAFGNTIEGTSGLSSITGPEGGAPYMLSNAFGDPISGLNGTLAVLAALSARDRDGRGRCIEAAQLEGFLPIVGEALIETQLTGTPPARRGNHRPGAEPSGIYPAAGEDAWVAIEVRSDDQWFRLATAIGEPWAANSDLVTTAGRAASRATLESHLATWTAARSAAEVADICARAGVAAAPVNNESDMLAFEPLTASDFFVGEERAVVGFHLYPTLPITADDARALTDRPAPTLGEHTAEILSAMGLSASEIARLEEEDIIGDRPPVLAG